MAYIDVNLRCRVNQMVALQLKIVFRL